VAVVSDAIQCVGENDDCTHSLLACKSCSSPHGVVSLLHVLGGLCRIFVYGFIEEDAMHLDALGAIGPT
jgi:hypothetical protein